MKGVILVGGLGTRLMPMTRITNKHLLPVGGFPMVYYPLYNLVEAGVRDIMIVTGGNSPGDFLELLHDGSEFGLDHLSFVYQRGAGGIADALRLTRNFVGDERVVVILGDNILGGSIRPFVEAYRNQPSGAKALLKSVSDAERFGVAEVAEDGRVLSIVEKPDEPASDLAVVGVYMFDETVWEIVAGLKPSARGQLEITDVNNAYLERGDLTADVLECEWSDAGTVESLARAAEIARASAFWQDADLPSGQGESL